MPILRRKTGEPPPDLIFNWHRESGVCRRTAACLMLAGGLVTGWFYLFHVSMPAADRAIPAGRPMRTITRAAGAEIPAGRPVIRPSTLPEDLQADLAALKAVVPDWPRAWENRPSPLLNLPENAAVSVLPAVLPAGAVLLPPVTGAEPLRLPQPPAIPEVTAAPPEQPEEGDAEEPDEPEPVAADERVEIAPVLMVQSGFGGLAPLASPRWKAETFDDAWPAAGSASFMLAVEESGRVTQCFPLSIPAGANAETLRPELMQLRWPAAGGRPLRWGTVDVRW